MNILQAIILGIFQGLTEFLPISSTAHVTIVGKIMGLVSADRPEEWTAFLAVIQLGTLIAVLSYFRKDIVTIVRDFINQNILQRIKLSNQTSSSKMGWFVIVGSVPIVVVGLGLKKILEGSLTKDISLIAFALIGLAIVLFVAEKFGSFKKTITDITWRDAVIVGFAQCLALIPGSSRSGTTLAAGFFCGMTRESAARFSFLLSIPAVLGSGLLELKQSIEYLSAESAVALIIATIFSTISGYAAIAGLLRYLRTHTSLVFILYRIILGIVLLWSVSENLL